MPSSESPALTGRTGPAIERLTLRQPDDWHVHLRDDAMLASVVNYTARQFARAIVMPNLKPPVTTVAAARAYRERILEAVEPGLDFTPLMTCYLTDGMDPGEVERVAGGGEFSAEFVEVAFEPAAAEELVVEDA
jgi:dihydroorotase